MKSLTPNRLSARIRCPLSSLLAAVLIMVSASYPAPEARAGFMAYSRATAFDYLGGFGDEEDFNSTSLAGTEKEVDIRSTTTLGPFPGTTHASAYAAVLPRQPGALVSFRGSSEVRVNGYGDSHLFYDVYASSTSEWFDVLHFEPVSVEAARINAWGVYLDLSGELMVEGDGAEAFVGFGAEWGGSSGLLQYPQDSSGSQTFRHKLSEPIWSNVNPFGPEGIALRSFLGTYARAKAGGPGREVTASAHFGHTGEFPGFVALDAQGNILPDAPDWVRVTSDSGIEYAILRQAPTADAAAPEPATIAVWAVGGCCLFVARWRRQRQATERASR